MTAASRRIITTAARDPSRSMAAPTLSDRALSLPNVTQGFNISAAATSPPPMSSEPAPSCAIITTAQDSSQSTTIPMPSNYPLPHPNVMQGSVVPSNPSAMTAVQPYSGALTMQPHSAELSVPPNTDALSIGTAVACQRVAADIARTQVQQPNITNQRSRKPRTCRRCARPECPGKKSIQLCRNQCQDCGRIGQCNGRNPDRAKRQCHDAWVPL